MQNEVCANFNKLLQLLRARYGTPACWPHVDQARHLTEDGLQKLIDDLVSDDEH